MNNKCLATLLALVLAKPAAAAVSGGGEILTLADAVNLALAHDPALGAAGAAQREETARARAASAAFSPEAWIGSTPGYASGLPVTVAGNVPSLVNVDVRQTLYSPDRRASVLEAAGRSAVAGAALAKARIDTSRRAAAAYLRCWADGELRKSAARRLLTTESERVRVEALAAEGRRTPLDVERALLEVARARQLCLDRDSDFDLDRRRLSQLTGWPADRPVVLEEDALAGIRASSGEDTLGAAVGSDPVLHAMQSEREMFEKSFRVLNRPIAPTVEADVRYLRLYDRGGYSDYFRRYKANDFSAGIAVAIPLWTGGRRAAESARAAAAAERVEDEILAKRLAVEASVAGAQAALARAESSLSLARRARGIAQSDRDAEGRLQEEGRADGHDVGEREVRLADAEDDVTRAVVDLAQARLALLELRGELPEALAQK